MRSSGTGAGWADGRFFRLNSGPLTPGGPTARPSPFDEEASLGGSMTPLHGLLDASEGGEPCSTVEDNADDIAWREARKWGYTPASQDDLDQMG